MIPKKETQILDRYSLYRVISISDFTQTVAIIIDQLSGSSKEIGVSLNPRERIQPGKHLVSVRNTVNER
jgi:hypothetical protein